MLKLFYKLRFEFKESISRAAEKHNYYAFLINLF